MGKLQVLPAGIANMIAAGEVVQRPSSVVKELMENAVDARADQISVVISDSGRTLVQVIDNGVGMSPEDARLCFERHATSKIATATDLEAILTYGFRGEALASIAAVAQVRLRTRRAEDEVCTLVTVPEMTCSECAGPVGTSFEVRNLFYNTPARRKFLKSDNVEFKHIVEEFTRIALIHPEISFSLRHNGRDVFVLRKASSLKFRIQNLLGSGVVGEVVDIASETSLVKVSGFVGRPQGAKKTLGNQYFFVNGRFFRSPYLHKAVMKAYEEMLPSGLTPSYFIFLETDPHSIDVNIHPTKTEVKFEDEQVLFQILYACIRETLGRNSFGADLDFDTAGAVNMPSLGTSFDEYRPVTAAPAVDFDPDYDPFATFNPGGEAAPVQGVPDFGFPVRENAAADFTSSAQNRSDAAALRPAGNPVFGKSSDSYGALFEESIFNSSKVMVLKGKYALTPAASGVMVVNLRRASERIIFDRTLSALSRGTHVTQKAMFPVSVQVGVAQRLLFDDNADLLSSLGFEITPEGEDTLVVSGVPEGYSCDEGRIEEMVSNLGLILAEDHGGLPEMVNATIAGQFATLGAVSSDKVSSPLEAQSIIDTLFASENAEYTPNGRRIVRVLSIEEIDKLF